MKTPHVIALSMLAGIALGATAIQGLHAQAKPPVYAIVDIDEVTDPALNATNTGRTNEAAATVFKDTGGRFLVRTDKITALDGTPPKRVIISVFESIEKAKAYYNSPEQMKVNDARMKSTKSRMFIAEGL
jgi:uncharacterized protein (DUF1330 family)